MKNQEAKRMFYEMKIAGVKRQLPLCPLNDELMIGAFVIFGDPELTTKAARALLKKAPEYDYIIAPEAKAIPLIHEMARLDGNRKYLLARKTPKLYMSGVMESVYRSITTAKEQILYLDMEDAKLMKDKRIILLDDVISTGESIRSLEALVNKAGGKIVARMAILAEGDAADRDDIIYLERLPLFDKNGNPIGQ